MFYVIFYCVLGVILVTDAISAMGLLDGVHHIGDKTIEIRNNQAYIANSNTLCGSIATMNMCVKYFMEAAGDLIFSFFSSC